MHLETSWSPFLNGKRQRYLNAAHHQNTAIGDTGTTAFESGRLTMFAMASLASMPWAPE